MTPSLVDRWTRGWRGPLLAALIALAAALPGALALPATDRGEARFAEATAQMLENGDVAGLDDAAPGGRLGLHWIQAAGVALASNPEARRIWAFRLPAVAGGMLAAAACAWGGAALFGPSTGFLAGAIMATAALTASAAVIDLPGSVLGAGVTLAVAALARLRLAAEGGFKAGRPTRILLWLGVALAALSGGAAGVAAVAGAGAALWLMERRALWMRDVGWGWGLILIAALVGPAAIAAMVAGASPGLAGWTEPPGGQRWPGLQLFLSPLLLFPFALLLPAGLAAARREGRRAPMRLTLCWLLPTWAIVEFAPGVSPARGLAFYGALAWLCAAGARGGVGQTAARIGAGLQVAAGAATIAILLYLGERFGGRGALAWAALAAALTAAAALGGAALLIRGRVGPALLTAGSLGLLAHDAASAGLGPRLDALWTAQRAAERLAAAGLDPRGGVTPGPVAITGLDQPSLVFALGGQAEDVSAAEAAAAVAGGRPAIVEAGEEAAFRAAVGNPVRRVAEIDGFDYATGAPVRLVIYGPVAPRR